MAQHPNLNAMQKRAQVQYKTVPECQVARNSQTSRAWGKFAFPLEISKQFLKILAIVLEREGLVDEK